MGRSLSRLIRLTAAVSSTLLVVGCDQGKSAADRSIRQALDSGAAKTAGGDFQGAIAAIQPVAGNTSASLAMQVQAKAALANAQMAEGNRVLRELDLQQIEAVRLIREMELLGIRIGVGNTLEKGYGLQKPDDIQKDYQKKIADATGSPDKPAWFADEKGGVSLPTLAAVKQTVSSLQTEIAKRQAEIDALVQKQNDQQAQVDKLQLTADGAKGREAVDAYRTASDARKVLADISAQIDTAKANLSPFQHDLDVAQAQQAVVDGYIAAVREQAKALTANWNQIQQAAAAQKALAVTIVGTSGKTTADAATVAAKSAELSTVLTDAKKLADEAEQDLTSAVKSAADAVSLAEELRRTIEPLRVEAESKDVFSAKIAYKNLLDVYSPTYFKMQKGIVETQVANMYGNQVSTLKAKAALVKQLTDILQKADIKMPEGLADADLAKQIQEAKANADQHYTAASDELDAATNAALATDQRGNQARLARIFTMYDWAKFAHDNGDEKGAKAHMDEAVAAKEAVLQGSPGAAVSLPDELLPPPPKLEAPATAPAVAAAGAVDPAVAAEVKKMLNDAIDAAIKGDMEAVKGHLIVSPIQQPTVDVVLSLMSGSVKLKASMVTKFGQQAVDDMEKQAQANSAMKMQIPKPEDIQKALAMVDVQAGATADVVTIGAPGQAKRLPVKKVDNAWKIDLATLGQDPQLAMMMPMIGTMFKPMADNINQVAADVEAGKYASINDVMEAVKKGMPQMPGAPANPNVAGNQNPPPAPAPAPQPAQDKPQGRDVINNPANLPQIQ